MLDNFWKNKPRLFFTKSWIRLHDNLKTARNHISIHYSCQYVRLMRKYDLIVTTLSTYSHGLLAAKGFKQLNSLLSGWKMFVNKTQKLAWSWSWVSYWSFRASAWAWWEPISCWTLAHVTCPPPAAVATPLIQPPCATPTAAQSRSNSIRLQRVLVG